MVDELSNLKKNRVRRNKEICTTQLILCLRMLHFLYSFLYMYLSNRKFIPSRGTATYSSWQTEPRHLVQTEVCVFVFTVRMMLTTYVKLGE